MNWYKKAQQIPTMENINWAIDDLLLNEVLTDDDYSNIIINNMEQILQNKDENVVLPKAAQVATKSKPRRYNRPVNIPPISSPSKKDIMEEIRNQTEVMDLSNVINTKSIARVLNVSPRYVKRICDRNSIDLRQCAMKRRFYVEKIIIEFMSIISKNITSVKESYNLFSQKYNHKIKIKKFNLMLRYNNLMSNLQNKPENIYLAFEGFIRSEHTNSRQNMEVLIQSGRINDLLNKFLDYYGSAWGFETPIAKDMMHKFLMTKLQIRDKAIRNQELGQFFNQTGVDVSKNQKLFSLIEKGVSPKDIAKQTGIDINQIKHFYDLYQNKKPPVYDSSHPSYFLGKQEQPNELV